MRRGGFLFEAGPQCPRFPSELWRLVGALNLESEFVRGNPKLKRYILRDRTLHPAPFSPPSLLLTGLVGLGSKLRVLAEAFGFSQPPPAEETLAEFVSRKFGCEILENLVDPFVSTIFQGDSYKMGMQSALPALVEWERNHGSVVRGAIRASRSNSNKPSSNGNTRGLHVTEALPALGSFKAGMGRLVERLTEELFESIHYNVKIRFVAPLRDPALPTARWQVVLSSGQRITTEHLVLATPACVSAGLLADAVPQLAAQLGAIEYASTCVVSSAYERSAVAHPLDGFGFMVPRREKLLTNCTFWNSSLFPERAPKGKVLITSFSSSKAADDDPAWDPGGVKHVRTVERENAKILGITGRPLDRVIWKNCPALPQFNLGHSTRIGAIHEILRTQPSLYLAGNFLQGRSMGDCVKVAFGAAERLQAQKKDGYVEAAEVAKGAVV